MAVQPAHALGSGKYERRCGKVETRLRRALTVRSGADKRTKQVNVWFLKGLPVNITSRFGCGVGRFSS
jgi:hypothetical protein